MSKNKKKKKKFSIVSMISAELGIIYITLLIGSFINSFTNSFNLILLRYIPVVIVTLISTYFLIRWGAKNNLKSDKNSFWMQIMVVPLIVAIIIFLFGMYNIKVNSSKIDGKYSLLKSRFSKEYEDILNKAKKTARTSWIITSVVYVISSGTMTLILKSRIDDWLQEDEAFDIVKPENRSQTTGELPNEINQDNTNLNENSENEEDNAIKKIKWDL